MRAGFNPIVPPVAYLDESGKAAGFVADYTRAVAKEAGYESVQFVVGQPSNTTALAEGRLDVVAMIVYSEERAKTLDYSIPALALKAAVFARTGSPPLKDIADLRGRKIAIARASVTERYFHEHPEWDAQLVPVASTEAAVMAVDRGECDTAVNIDLVAQKFIRDRKLEHVVRTDLVLPNFSYKYYLVVRKDSGPLLHRLNDAQIALRDRGDFARIYEKWIGPLETRQLTWRDLRPLALPATLVAGIGIGVLLWQRRNVVRLARQAEVLRESEEKFSTAFHASPSPMSITERETDRLIDVNECFVRSYGWAREAVVGRTTEEIGLWPADSRREFQTLMQEQGAVRGFKTQHRAVDDQMKVVSLNADLVKLGGSTCVLVVAHDISEQERAAGALRESEARFRELFENSPDPIFVENAQGEVLEVNAAACRMHGLARNELIGRNALDLVPPAHRASVANDLSEWLSGKLTRSEGFSQTSDGRVLTVELRGAVIHHGGRPAVLLIVRDLTERNRAEKEREKLQSQLIQAQKLESVGRLAGGVAHDFNNMLTAIEVNAALALGALKKGTPISDHLQEIRRCTHRSANLTRQLLAFARQQTIMPQVLDLNATVEGMLKLLRRIIGENIQLIWQPVSGLWPICIDPSQVDQVLANLCVNARDAISGVGKITLTTGNLSAAEFDFLLDPQMTPGDYIVLNVSDDGCGMTPEVLEHLFEPFYTTKPMGQGTGLGLATVFGIVKQNRGSIKVESEPGRGSTFRIFLPRHTGRPEESPETVEAAPLPRGRESILLVEDESTVLQAVRLTLAQLGYQVLAAGTPGEATRIVGSRRQPVDLLLVDVIMPEMSGRDLAGRLQTIQPRLKVLFMSGYTANIIAPHGVLEPGIRFLQKPFSTEALAANVRAALDAEVTPVCP